MHARRRRECAERGHVEGGVAASAAQGEGEHGASLGAHAAHRQAALEHLCMYLGCEGMCVCSWVARGARRG